VTVNVRAFRSANKKSTQVKVYAFNPSIVQKLHASLYTEQNLVLEIADLDWPISVTLSTAAKLTGISKTNSPVLGLDSETHPPQQNCTAG
jgi:hypothetical protein